MQHKQIRRNELIDDDGFNDGFNSSANFQRDPSQPTSVPSESSWYASSNLEKEDGILKDDENTRSAEVEERPEDIDQSALTTLGQLKHTLPDIPGRGEEPQE